MDARLPLRSLFTCAVGLAALVAVTSGCGGGGDAQAAASVRPTPAKYSDSNLSFTYPARWRASPYKGPGELHFQPIVYLSTQPVHEPCKTQGNATSCGFPIGHLERGGVLVIWQFPYVLPGATPPSSGTPIRVGGHHGTRTATARGVCRQIGADRTIDVEVPSSGVGDVEITACLRGPHLAQDEKRFDAMLASTKFAS